MTLAILEPPALDTGTACTECGEEVSCLDGCRCDDCLEECQGCNTGFLPEELHTRKALVTVGPGERAEDVRLCNTCVNAGVFDNYSDEDED